MSIIFNIIFILILAVWFLRFAGECGYTGKSKLFTYCRCNTSYQGERLTKADVIHVALFAFGMRILVYILGVGCCMLFHDQYHSLNTFTWSDFLSTWNIWDGRHYLGLAESGYAGFTEVTEWSGKAEHLRLVFFPLYPWLIRLLHAIIGNWEVCGLILSNLAFCAGSVYFYGTVKEEYGTEIAQKSYWLLLLYPFSFFFGGIMTESLFFFLIAAGFFYIRRHLWPAVAVFGFLAALCRVQGILLLGVGMVEFFVCYRPIEMWRQKKTGEFIHLFFTKAIVLFLIPVGNVIYLWINKTVEGDPFKFSVYQKNHWYHTTTWFTNGLADIWNNATMSSTTNALKICVWYPELILFLLAIVLTIYALKTQPLKYSAYLFVYTLVNYSITFLLSGGRYMANALPMFFFLAAWTDKHKPVYKIICCLFGLFFTLYLIGYLCGEQVF